MREAQITREIRCGVVMYGGVSLAIYMNGITQELLRLVRAGTPDPADAARLFIKEPSKIEAVYRDVLRTMDGQPLDTGTIKTRVVIDALSGTSAGGINAVFLAKALANDQSIAQLAKLWVEEGAIERLINDAESVDGTRLATPRQPAALLNGDRMYLKLLAAFDGMDDEAGSEKPRAEARRATSAQYSSPYITDGLDLFVTTTDINGLPIRLRLYDETADERRHKQAFRLRFRTTTATGEAGLNDFRKTNPFLAFACRATSSFPFAFAPMTFESVDTLLKSATRSVVKSQEDPSSYEKFFGPYLHSQDDGRTVPQDDPSHYRHVAFGDGGYLDNKPFGYTIGVLSERQSGMPGRRMLVFIDPTPEAAALARDNVPNAIQNASAALIGLPTYETIREDLRRVLDRNRMIQRVQRVLDRVDEYVKGKAAGTDGILSVDKRPEAQNSPTIEPVISRQEWLKTPVRELVDRYGPAYAGYHALRMAAATDDLVAIVAVAAGLEDGSAEFVALRRLVRAWRESQYDDTPGHYANQFLDRFDVAWVSRRLRFVRAEVDRMLQLLADPSTRADSWPSSLPRNPPEGLLREYRQRLTTVLASLAHDTERLFSADDNPVHNLLAAPFPETETSWLGVLRATLNDIVSADSESRRDERAATLATRYARKLELMARRIARNVHRIQDEARAFRDSVYRQHESPTGTAEDHAVHEYVYRLHHYFEQYDAVAFPLLTATDIGELTTVDVVRIAPEKTGRLGGEKLFHFGAFLEQRWRVNDLLWGRLDGARRLIKALLNGVPTASLDALVQRAHEAILEEYITDRQAGPVAAIVANAVLRDDRERASYVALQAQMQNPDGRETVRSVLAAAMKPDTLATYYRERFTFDPELNRERTLRSLARSVTVVGRILDSIADDPHAQSPLGLWVGRVGQILWGLVEVAAPGSLWNKLTRNWTVVLALCGLLLIGLGVLFGLDAAPKTGMVILALAMAARFITLEFSRFMNGKPWSTRLAAVIAVTVVLAFAGLGIADAVNQVRAHWVTLLDAKRYLAMHVGGATLAGGVVAGLLAFVGLYTLVRGTVNAIDKRLG